MMAILTATCATFVATLNMAQPGDVVHLPQQPTRCGYIRIHNVKKAGPGVGVEIAPTQRIGLHITASEGLHFNGGHFEGAASSWDLRWSLSGIYVRGASRLSFRNATFGHPESQTQIMAYLHDVTDLEISGSRFQWATSDGIMVRDSERLRFTDNIFFANGALQPICTWPDGREEIVLNPTRCRNGGGTWVDGSHPDGIQMFSNVQDVLIARNRFDGFMQGVGWHGAAGERGIRRIWVVDNEVRTTYGWGVKLDTENSFARGNRLGWPAAHPNPEGWPTMLAVNPARGGVACENVLLANGSFHPWGSPWDQPCSAVTLPPEPAAPQGLPDPDVDCWCLPSRSRE
jgi:hypothetical protein